MQDAASAAPVSLVPGLPSRLALPAAGLALGVVAALVAVSACRTPVPAADDLAADDAWTSVGDAACASCHADISATYARSGMGRAVSRFTRDGAPERFDAAGRSPVVCAPDDGTPAAGYCYQAFVRGDTLFQRETHPAEPGVERVYPASHVVGSGNATRSYLMTAGETGAEGGYLTEMPLTWYVERGIWDLSPGYDTNNARFERPIALECLTCHDATPGHAPSQNFYTSVPLGISCERCHGPGSAHVAAFEAGGAPDETFIVNPKRLSTALQLDVCQQCHLTGETVYAAGQDPTTYRPGRPLAAHRAVFATAESLQDPESFGIASHAERLAQSACFEGSLGSPAPMTCTTCHDPHVAQEELPPDTYSAACRTCHTPGASGTARPGHGPLCDRPGATTPALALQGDCASCHMRRAGTSDIPHVSFTDHWIRKSPPPDRAGGATRQAEARTTPFTLVNVVLREGALEGRPAPPRPRAQTDVEMGMALFSYYDTAHRLPAYLPRAAALLRRGLAGGHDRTDARIALGRALAEMDSLQSAVAVLADAASRDTSSGPAALWLGATRLDAGDAAGAARDLRRAVRLMPRYTEARIQLAEALASGPAARPAEAAAVLDAALRADPVRHTSAWNDLGFYRLQAGDLPGATAALRRAVALDPRLPTARVNLGTALLSAGDLPAAAAQFEAALRLAPETVSALGNLGVVRQRQGRTADARRLFERVLALEPGSPQATAALASLGS